MTGAETLLVLLAATGETTTTGAVPDGTTGEATAVEVVVSGWYA